MLASLPNCYLGGIRFRKLQAMFLGERFYFPTIYGNENPKRKAESKVII